MFPLRRPLSQSQGIPILLANDFEREALTSGESPGDPRSRFYQESSDYLREQVGGREELEYAFQNADTSGLILEVGAGAGTFAGFGGSDYCALDYSVSYLQTYLNGYSRICATAETIPLSSRSCRLVFSIATLEHVPRPDLACEEIDRVLVTGGIAYLAPAWHCRDWAADGLSVRPYRDLSHNQKIRKALIPLRNSLIYRGIQEIPWRLWRRSVTKLSGIPSRLRYRRLRANYEHFWQSDSDACSSIDSHEGILFFESRGYEILRPRGGSLARVLFRAGALIARKC